MFLLVDSHEDLAWNILVYGRDYTRSVQETRRLERGAEAVEQNGETLLGWDEYQRGRVALVFSTLFAPPANAAQKKKREFAYETVDEAVRVYRKELDIYRDLVERHPDKFRFVLSKEALRSHLDEWQKPESTPPVGLVPLMEGADGIRDANALEEWWSLGLRIIGLAWRGTRYSGGTMEPGPLTDAGRDILKAMASFPFLLDLSHMDEEAALQALDVYEGPILVSHGNADALMPDSGTNRHLTDAVIRGVVERGGVIGLIPFNRFLKVGWTRGDPPLPLTYLANHIDYVCQLAGDAYHAALGTDFDGGFGRDSVPEGIDSIADLPKIADILANRGYTEEDIGAVLGGNWISFLRKTLPDA